VRGALHELGHSTGHPDRLNRDLAHPFGSEGYAREELRAEIASLILGSEVGLGYDPGQHAGEQTIFYIGHLDGVANGYAENNRTKEVRRWKARGQGLSEEEKNELLAEAEKKRYERRQQERERFEATADRLSGELRSLSSGVEKTAYHGPVHQRGRDKTVCARVTVDTPIQARLF
jgi:Zincin-like metallopeptidase